ncbi:MAG: glutamine--tRNA ligase/YqeY domain fusion protein [Oscillospiraceae bacterium]|jgi:glutaminyl-tRNA synthetase|nr:glutamine--tRNA ligase/YqeY domain fusion protein [Oscillospiraceae bacterium]
MEYPANFIHDIIERDIASGMKERIHTRFPPEPNGYLHIGSAKAVRINSEAAKRYGGLFNLRYDDTNPAREEDEYVNSIYEDVKWLTGEEPSGGVFFGSDYFDKCHEFAVGLIKDGKAYVCDLSGEEMREYRGTLTEAGRESPYRDRSVEENLALFERMKNGEFPDGHCTLRAKIDMASPNMNMRDPAIYRIVHTPHHRQGNKWCIYPLYDYAHPIQDALEGVTHSCCSIEFENHRPLYDWVVENIGFDPPPRQYEFARLNVTYTVMSKRYLRELVETGLVDGWDDPRMPTVCGLRRRGYTPSAINDFLDRAGYSKALSMVDIAVLEHCMREELNAAAPRRIAVTEPLPVTVTNFPEGKTEFFSLPNNPNAPETGTRSLPFTRRLYIERSDFSDNPPPKFHRLKPGAEVRLMGAYIIRCDEVVRDADGNVVELLCSADIETGNGNPADGRKVKGTVHWLSADDCADGTVMMYDRLFTAENVLEQVTDDDYGEFLNKESVRRIDGVKLEKSLLSARKGERFQFVRNGYFCLDSKHGDASGHGVWNSIVSLKSSFKPPPD